METFEEQKKELGYWTLFWDLISRDEVKQKDLEGLPEEYKKQALEVLKKNGVTVGKEMVGYVHEGAVCILAGNHCLPPVEEVELYDCAVSIGISHHVMIA